MIKSVVIISNNHLLNNIGGAEVQADLLGKHLNLKGIKVSYISGDIKQRIDYHGYEIIPRPDNNKDFFRLLKELDADVYYQRGRKKLTGEVAKFCKKNNKKFIFAASMDIDCQRFKFFQRGSRSIKLIEIIRNAKKNLIKIYVDLFSLWGMRQANLVLSQTNFQKNALEENVGIKSQLFYNLHPKPEVVKGTTQKDIPVVLWLANLKSWKQPELYLKMVKDLSGEKINFLMAGHIKKDKYEDLIREAEGLNNNFEYLGGKTFQESNELINSADIFVNTSKEQEGFPNTFIQAWLRGVPVVTLNFDPDNMIQEYNLGYVANSYENLLKYVLHLCNNKTERSEIGKKALFFSNKNFLIDEKINEFLTMIDQRYC